MTRVSHDEQWLRNRVHARQLRSEVALFRQLPSRYNGKPHGDGDNVAQLRYALPSSLSAATPL